MTRRLLSILPVLLALASDPAGAQSAAAQPAAPVYTLTTDGPVDGPSTYRRVGAIAVNAFGAASAIEPLAAICRAASSAVVAAC